MIKLKARWMLLAVVTMTLMLNVASMYAGSALAVKKSTSSLKTPNVTTTTSTHHLKGVKVFRVHTVPSKTCKAQQVTLKPWEQSHVLSPNLSGLIYRATAPGITNATMTFKYGALTATTKSPARDTISRVYTFNILPAGHQPTSLQQSPPYRSSWQPGVLKLVP